MSTISTAGVVIPHLSSGHPSGPFAGDIWRHTSTGTLYHVLGIVQLESTNEPAVLYIALNEGKQAWVRAVDDWFMKISPSVCRFVLVSIKTTRLTAI